MYERECGRSIYRRVKVECVANFLDKINNETKNIIIESYIIIGELNEIMQSTKRM